MRGSASERNDAGTRLFGKPYEHHDSRRCVASWRNTKSYTRSLISSIASHRLGALRFGEQVAQKIRNHLDYQGSDLLADRLEIDHQESSDS
jgi:hypothetical protein